MDVKPIKNESDYDGALAEVADLMDARADMPEGDGLDVLVTLVEAYEEKHWRVNPPDPIDAIKLRMQQRGLSRSDLEKMLGSKSRVSEVLNRKRPDRLGNGLVRYPEDLRDGSSRHAQPVQFDRVPSDALIGERRLGQLPRGSNWLRSPPLFCLADLVA